MSSPSSEMMAQMPQFAEPFTSVNSIQHIPGQRFLEFSNYWQISVQSLGGTYLMTNVTPFRTLLLLELHIKDKHHQAQRNYANCQERALQAAVYCTPFVQQLIDSGKKIFIKSLLGPSNEQSVFDFSYHFYPLLELLDVSFRIHGCYYVDLGDIVAFRWHYSTHVTQVQSKETYFSGTFEAIAGQTADPLGLLDGIDSEAPVPNPQGEEIIEEPKTEESEAKRVKMEGPKQTECVVCLDELTEKQKAVLVPCGHANYCWECASELETCALCRTKIAQCIKIFT